MVQGYSCLRWTKSIPYVFNGEYGDSSDIELVKAVEEAMQDWTNKTGENVKFHRASSLRLAFAKLWSTGVVDIRRTNENCSRAQVGYGVGLAEFRISNRLFNQTNGVLDEPNELKHNTRHELGHIIGIIHE